MAGCCRPLRCQFSATTSSCHSLLGAWHLGQWMPGFFNRMQALFTDSDGKILLDIIAIVAAVIVIILSYCVERFILPTTFGLLLSMRSVMFLLLWHFGALWATHFGPVVGLAAAHACVTESGALPWFVGQAAVVAWVLFVYGVDMRLALGKISDLLAAGGEGFMPVPSLKGDHQGVSLFCAQKFLAESLMWCACDDQLDESLDELFISEVALDGLSARSCDEIIKGLTCVLSVLHEVLSMDTEADVDYAMTLEKRV